MNRSIVGAAIAVLLAAAGPVHAQHALAVHGSYDPSVPTPASVLGYELGERFTPHHMVVRYLERLVAASPRVRLDTVAHTFEGREVLMAIVTNPANHQRLDAIRADAKRLADPRGVPGAELDAVIARTPVITWMGYTVHGPEASGLEAALGMLYQLAAGQDAETRMVLDSSVVLVDPVQNPDGHERHVQDVMRMRTAFGVPVHPQARIHSGTWPGPRTSHYYFDLNRDWYGQSHPETRGRVEAMLDWWPHVATDLHEMSPNSSYFFPPPMAPLNVLVHPNIKSWWDTFAAANITAFDANGWSYFRREGYDEFYPGYGSSWPLYTGAVGMTYEQASSRGGAIMRTDGTVLTLQEAARRHYAAAWATVTTSARLARKRVRDYAGYRREVVSEAMSHPLRAVAFARDASGRADSLAQKLRQNGIVVHRTRSGATVANATPYGSSERGRVTIPANSYVVDLAQPQGRLARVLLEPDAPLDSTFITEELERRRTGQSDRFYDMTAWSLPYTFRVRAWALGTPPTDLEVVGPPVAGSQPPATARYGYAIETGSEAGLRTLGALLADSVRAWHAPRGFRIGGEAFPGGAFLVRAAGNDTSVHQRVRRAAEASGARVVALSSSAVEEGADLGSNSITPLRAPRVAIATGAPIAGQSFGYAWYAFDQRLRIPTTALELDAITGSALDDFNVLVVPSVSPGAMSRAIGDQGRDRIAAWVRNGGVLITLDAATDWLAAERTGLSRFRARPDGQRSDSTGGAPLPASVPGAIVRAITDSLSPFLAGIEEREIPVQYFSDRIYTAPRDVRPGEVVVRYAPLPKLRLAGYMWPEVPARLAGTPYMWTERVGRGRVIGFAGDPVFRDLWPGLLPLFGNAVLLGGSY